MYLCEPASKELLVNVFGFSTGRHVGFVCLLQESVEFGPVRSGAVRHGVVWCGAVRGTTRREIRVSSTARRTPVFKDHGITLPPRKTLQTVGLWSNVRLLVQKREREKQHSKKRLKIICYCENGSACNIIVL